IEVEEAQHCGVVDQISLGYEHASVADFDVVGMSSSGRTNLTHGDRNVVRCVDQCGECGAVHMPVAATWPNVAAASPNTRPFTVGNVAMHHPARNGVTSLLANPRDPAATCPRANQLLRVFQREGVLDRDNPLRLPAVVSRGPSAADFSDDAQ